MLRIAIVEDEPSARKQIEKYIERYSETEHLEIQTILFRLDFVMKPLNYYTFSTLLVRVHCQTGHA